MLLRLGRSQMFFHFKVIFQILENAVTERASSRFSGLCVLYVEASEILSN